MSRTYPPFHVAASKNWLWDASVTDWLDQRYFLPLLAHHALLLWTVPLLALVVCGILWPVVVRRRDELPWLFHVWLFAGVLFYLVGAQELVRNPWNFHVLDPAVTALAAQGMVAIASLISFVSSGVHLPFNRSIITRATLLLLLTMILATGLRNLQYLYHPYALQGYQLGLALRRISQPGDLVVTMANAIGEPVAIYYSQRKGWVFPPAWKGVAWSSPTIADGAEAIQLFEQIRAQGADWFGMVIDQRNGLRDSHSTLLSHIEETCELYETNPAWVIYRIPH